MDTNDRWASEPGFAQAFLDYEGDIRVETADGETFWCWAGEDALRGLSDAIETYLERRDS